MQRWSGVRTVKDFQEGFQKKGHLACALTSSDLCWVCQQKHNKFPLKLI